MICPNCSTTIPDQARFCPNCGKRIESSTEPNVGSRKYGFADIATGINKLAGIETPVQLNLKNVFSQVFKKHTEEEAEKLFYVGTSQTTPKLEELVETWPKPWLFARVFLIAALCYFGLYIGFNSFNDINFLPGLILMGSFMVPFSLLIFFWEMNAPQNIPIYRIMQMAFIGGIISLVIAVFFENNSDVSSAVIAGLSEEIAKVLVLIWFLRNKKYSYNYILNGLLIGAAIGAGFASFETAGYALNIALHSGLDTMYNTIFWRGVLAPGGHIAWAALTGAALCMVKGKQAFRWTMLKSIKFVRIFLIVVVLHTLWDLPDFNNSDLPLAQLVLTLISWIIAFAMIHVGLTEISKIKEQASASE